jgi:hypothetical protein
MLSHRIEREMEYLAKTTLPLDSFGIIHSLSVFRTILHFGTIFTHIYLFTIGEKVYRAYISLKYPFLAIHAKGEESMSQSKRTAPPPNFKNEVFKIDILLCSKGGESSIFKTCKTLLNTKRRILFRGSFV